MGAQGSANAGFKGAAAPVPGDPGHFSPARLQKVFNTCFSQTHRTLLAGGAPEPLYQPASDQNDYHLLHYRLDYFASALHETAHWCIAGEQRRLLQDFGYWYAPDGRNAQQQRAFEAVEYKPQALEWFFSRACAYRFRLSTDNLAAPAGSLPDDSGFKRKVLEQAQLWQRTGLPRRAAVFFLALREEFDTRRSACELDFCLSELA